MYFIDRQTINCNKDGINQFQYINLNTTNQLRYDYKCLGASLETPSGVRYTAQEPSGCGNNDCGNTVYLDRHNVDCNSNPILNFKLESNPQDLINYKYQCGNNELTECTSRTTNWDEESSNSAFLDRHDVKCNPDEVLTQFQLVRNYNDADNKFRYNYKCCKAK